VTELPSIAFSPRLNFLSEADKPKLYQAALTLLDEVGMKIQHPEAISVLEAAGCRVDEGWVKIPSQRVEQAIRSAPSNIPIFNREGKQVMDVGGRRSYFGTGSDLENMVDGETLERRPSTLEDIATAARLCDALDNVDFIMSCGYPHDVHPERANLESFSAMVKHSLKPIVTIAVDRADLTEIWEISKIVRGGEETLRAKPYSIHYTEPISPLKHPRSSLNKLLFCAKTGMPVIYSPAPIAGSTAPMTIAGHVVQGLAESLCGLVIHQLKTEGAPFLMGMGPAVLDMATTQCTYNAPEYLMAYMAAVEMSRYLDLPNWGYAGTSDAQIPDGQATFEAGLLTFMSAAAGSNLNHDLGYLDFGLTGSLEMIVILNEIIDQIRRIQRGIPVDDDQIGLSVIAETVQTGHFLTHPHTLKHLRSTQWRPLLMNRHGYSRWNSMGRTSLLERARIRMQGLLDTHEPKPLAPEILAAIETRVTDYHAA
jgi:trimethylamine---corrinoid protein Co-methyltransferase